MKEKNIFLGGNTSVRNSLYIFYRKRTSETDKNNTSNKPNTIILLIFNQIVLQVILLTNSICCSLITLLKILLFFVLFISVVTNSNLTDLISKYSEELHFHEIKYKYISFCTH